jgi:hypothetical protein
MTSSLHEGKSCHNNLESTLIGIWIETKFDLWVHNHCFIENFKKIQKPEKNHLGFCFCQIKFHNYIDILCSFLSINHQSFMFKCPFQFENSFFFE